ncbi:hypothetical protein HDU93_009877 [Gonapodya sp. JEL0774]|nr:hypothetical protein HDU93_009877 [Gonapodya sp. JEL0774]
MPSEATPGESASMISSPLEEVVPWRIQSTLKKIESMVKHSMTLNKSLSVNLAKARDSIAALEESISQVEWTALKSPGVRTKKPRTVQPLTDMITGKDQAVKLFEEALTKAIGDALEWFAKTMVNLRRVSVKSAKEFKMLSMFGNEQKTTMNNIMKADKVGNLCYDVDMDDWMLE